MEFSACTFRTLGNAATPQNILTLENAAGSHLVAVVTHLYIEEDATAVLITVSPYARVSRTAAMPSGGTALVKVASRPDIPSIPGVVVRGANASDGGAATAITATAGSTLAQSYLTRLHTLGGQINARRVNLLDKPLVLMPGTAMALQVVAASAGSNAATNHYLASVGWREVARL